MDKIFTRKALRELAKSAEIDLPKDLENEIINMHLESRDAYAESAVNTALEENKPDEKSIKETETYKKLETEYNDYKNTQTAKATRESKEKAFRAVLGKGKYPQSIVNLAVKAMGATIDKIELDDKNQIKNMDVISGAIDSELSEYKPTTTTEGAKIPKPPSNTGGKLTKEEISKISDSAERQAAIRQNLELFGFAAEGE